MTAVTSTIDLIEVVWVIAALPGLWLWTSNARETRQDRAAALTIGQRHSATYLWAHFSVILTRTFVAIELLFVILGVVAMFRESPPDDPAPWFRFVSAGLLVAASVGLSWLAYRWRQVNRAILAAARERIAREQVTRLRPTEDGPPV